MSLFHTVKEMREIVDWASSSGKTIGLVPTMGALHEGHLTLIREAKKICNFVVVSVFVNPTQFLPGEDLEKYPRTLYKDAVLCEKEGVDAVFAPAALEMYSPCYDSWVDIGSITQTLEGAIRPGHFRGVTTVCTKLFNIVRPNFAFFGQKDYQQLVVIQKMVDELNMPLRVVQVDIVREPDGLAMSSRNQYLNSEDRAKATAISRSLFAAKEAQNKGEYNAFELIKIAGKVLSEHQDIRVDYLLVCDTKTLEPVSEISNSAVMLVAVHLGNTRLIDNVLLGETE